MTLDPATSAKITRYRPRHPPAAWDQIAPTVRAVVAATVTAVPYDVGQLLHVTAHLAMWAEAAGLPRDPDAWLRSEVIDAYVLDRATTGAPTSAQTYRTTLRRVRDALAWSDRGEPAPARLHAPAHPHTPYEQAELAALRHWAGSLRGQQRADALALMGLGAGFGLASREIAATRGTDLRRHQADHPLAHTGLNRLVVARAGWEDLLHDLAQHAGPSFLFRPGRATAGAKNLVSSWTSGHRPTPGLPVLSAGRLRASWIVELMRARLDHGLIAKAAGLASAASLNRYQHLVPPLGDQDTARLLRGPTR